MKYYLAYGSNLNKHQMKFRCPDAVPAGSCVLHNWELVFRRGVLTIEPCPGGIVPMGVWKISEADEKSLDRYEGFPHLYRKELFPVLLKNGKDGEAMAYIMNPGRAIEEPSFSYMRTVQVGYEDFGFDKAPLMKAYRKSKKGAKKNG